MKDFEKTYPLSKKISRFVGEAIRDYNMIRTGDSIMTGLSGGKDSLVMLLALALLKKRSPEKFELKACIVDHTGGGMQTEALSDFASALGVQLWTIKHDTWKIIADRGERSPCSFCANLRRGILASAAREANCTVLALGHHKDDAAETVLLNLLYEGRFKCWHPNMYMSRSNIRVIRPLAYVEERRLELEAQRLALPVTSSCCPYGGKSKRKSAKALVTALEAEAPEIKSNILHALKNINEKESWKGVTLNGEQKADN